MVAQSNKKTKVLYVITKSNFGGAQRYVYDLATNLPKEKFEVSVAMGGDGSLKDKLNDAKIKTFKLDRLGRDINIFDDVAVFFSLLKLLRKERPDVVHLNSSKIGGLGALAARVARTPRIVFTAHGWAFNEARDGIQKTLIKLLSWLTVFLCHRTITVSEFDGDQGRDMPLVGKKVKVVHNGISEIDFEEKDRAREILLGSKVDKLAEETLYIGAIAELHKNKGLEYAIKAIGYLTKNQSSPSSEGRPFVFVVIGEGEERKNLENLVKESKIGKHVFFTGYKENASSLLKAFDVFLMPSIKEGLPYVLLEAGMAELPVITSAVGGTPEIVDDMESGILVQPKSPEEISKAIVYMLENSSKMDEFGKNLRGKITDKFSTGQMLDKTMKIYQI